MTRAMMLAAALAFAGAPAWAGDIESMQLANQLGAVLAAEELCGLSYDPAAIAAFIEKNVAADDMGFPGMLRLMTDGARAQGAGLSASGTTAHCTQMRRIAKSYGFTK